MSGARMNCARMNVVQDKHGGSNLELRHSLDLLQSSSQHLIWICAP